MGMSNRRTRWEPVARHAAQVVGIDPDIFVAMITVESDWQPQATGAAGEVGLGQIIPHWHPLADVLNPVNNLAYAAALLRQHLDEFGGYRLAIAAYNSGAGAVREAGNTVPYTITTQHLARVNAELERMGQPRMDTVPPDNSGAVTGALVLVGLVVAWAIFS